MYVKEVLHPQIVKAKVPLSVIYFTNGHSSHTSWETADACKQLGIILVCLYANSTRMLQPLDVAVFKPLKQAWLAAVEDWKIENPNNYLKTENFAPMLQKSIFSLDGSIVQSGFKACGLYPFDDNAVDYTKCLGRTAVLDLNEIENTTKINGVDNMLGCGPSLNTNQSDQIVQDNNELLSVRQSDAEEIMTMIGLDRIHRYKNIQLHGFQSEDDHILYKVYLMLNSMDTQLEAKYSQCEYSNVDRQQDCDSLECPPLNIEPDYGKTIPTDAESFTYNEEHVLMKDENIAMFLDSPETPHRKGNLQYHRRSPPVLTSRRRLIYHELKETRKVNEKQLKQEKLKLREEQKIKKEELKRQKSELRKKKQAAKKVARKLVNYC